MFAATHTRVGTRGLRLAAGLFLMCAIASCKKEDAATDPSAPAARQAAAVPPQQAVSAQVAAMSADQLREAASLALREQRLYAPAGNNAMEYYVALRDKQPNDPAVASALTDLMPYALIAAEQSIGRDDFVEAQRLYALMEKTDPQAPALPRLKQSIADAQTSLAQRTADAEARTEEEAKRQEELEKQRLADQQRAQQQAAQQLAQQQAQQPSAEQAAARAAEQRAAEQRAAEQRAAQQRAAQQPAAPATPPATQPAAQPPAASASNELRAVSTPPPSYPPDALRSGQSGEVQVEFTVGTDGSVSNVRVVRATPPRVFDRAAVAAVRRWRFQPVGSPVTTRRTIGFNPGG